MLRYLRLVLGSAVIVSVLSACSDAGDTPAASKRAMSNQASPSTSATIASPYVAISSEDLFAWAETAYPGFFPGPTSSLTFGRYRFRYYPSTDNYLAVSDGEVFVLGPKLSNGLILSVGRVSDFTSSVMTHARTVDYYRALMPSPAYSDYDTAYKFAERYQLAAFHLDALYGFAPGTMFRKARIEGLPPFGKPVPNGGTSVAGFALPFDGVLEVHPDPAQVRYPQDFAVNAGRRVSIPDPYCALEPDTIRFPAAYMGTQPLPEIRVPAPLPAFERVVWLKDAWGKPNGNFVPGCVRDPRELFSATIRRMKKLGADTIVVFPWTSFDNTSTRWTVLNPAQTRSSTMGDEDLEWAVAEARRAGIAVIWRNQIQGFQDAQGNYLPYPQATAENVLKSYDALDEFLSERGAFLQRIGVAGVSLTPWYWTSFAGALPSEQFLARTRQNIQKLRAAGFTGRVIHDLVEGMPTDPYLGKEIDMFSSGVWANLDEVQAARATTAELKALFAAAIQGAKNIARGRKLMWEAMFASRSDGFVNSALEETFCTSGYGIEGGAFSGECLQDRKTTDFGIQARATQGFLEALFETAPELAGGVGVAYWMDDNLLPSFTFPNLAYSVRGKPAEHIVYRWFMR
jgi:hypothetical protein